MRRLLLAFGSVVLLGCPSAAQPDSLTHRLDAANAAYKQGQYDRAESAYRALLEAGHTSGALYYNLGNAYVRLDRLGQAIRYYEKARSLRPTDPRIQHSLEQARRRAGVYPGRLPPRGLAGLVQGWSPLAIFAGGMLLLIGAAIAMIRAWGEAPQAGRRPLVWGPLGGGLLLVAVALGTSYVQSSQQRAVVVAEQAPLHAAPTPTAAPDTTLPEGTLLGVQNGQAQWTEIRLADGTVGWVPTPSLGGI